MRRLLTTCALLAGAALLLAACGEEAPEPQTYAITGADYAFQGVPGGPIAVGSDLTFRNGSGIEVHELVLLRLPEGEERSIQELLELPEEEADALIGPGFKGVSIAMPNENGMVVEGSLVVDEPGRYIMVCFIPQGADPAELMAAIQQGGEGPPDISGGPPHIILGMHAEFTAE